MNNREFTGIMNQAIEAETEAYEFYRDVAGKVTDPAFKQIFADFASEEYEHKKQLEEIKTKEVHNFDFNGARDFKVSETVDLPRLSTKMKPVDAIALAMKKEEEAVKNYSRLANLSSDPEKQKVYSELADMEQEHKARMETLYTNTAFPEVW